MYAYMIQSPLDQGHSWEGGRPGQAGCRWEEDLATPPDDHNDDDDDDDDVDEDDDDNEDDEDDDDDFDEMSTENCIF